MGGWEGGGCRVYGVAEATVFEEEKKLDHLLYLIWCTVTCGQTTRTVGWVNFSEFEITVCGSCKMSKKTKLTFFIAFQHLT